MVEWASHQDQLMAIRSEVFIQEQKVIPALEIDSEDPQYLHVLACLHDQTPIGTARLLPSGAIGRMAVLKAYRGQGVGHRLLNSLLQEALKRDQQVWLNAQISAQTFYQKWGFTAVGETFLDADIVHIKMVYHS